MQVTDIVKDWLKSHGYDGLYAEECGCRIEDLAPCGGEGMPECCAGVYKPCDPKSGFDYFIGPKEPTPEDSGTGEHISQHSNGAEPVEICPVCDNTGWNQQSYHDGIPTVRCSCRVGKLRHC